jgi:hypothetical protein
MGNLGQVHGYAQDDSECRRRRGRAAIGCFLVKAAYARVDAKEGSKEGVGFGGKPVNVVDHTGAVVDFLQTYASQSKWNSRAALASAVAAILAAVSLLLP